MFAILPVDVSYTTGSDTMLTTNRNAHYVLAIPSLEKPIKDFFALMRNLGNFARDKGGYKPIEINNWIVMLKEDHENLSSSVKPTQRYQTGLERTTQFQNKLEGWLEDKGLLPEVAEIGKPTTFPLVMIACTPAVAKKIESLPEVHAVMVDGPYLSLIA